MGSVCGESIGLEVHLARALTPVSGFIAPHRPQPTTTGSQANASARHLSALSFVDLHLRQSRRCHHGGVPISLLLEPSLTFGTVFRGQTLYLQR